MRKRKNGYPVDFEFIKTGDEITFYPNGVFTMRRKGRVLGKSEDIVAVRVNPHRRERLLRSYWEDYKVLRIDREEA